MQPLVPPKKVAPAKKGKVASSSDDSDSSDEDEVNYYLTAAMCIFNSILSCFVTNCWWCDGL